MLGDGKLPCLDEQKKRFYYEIKVLKTREQKAVEGPKFADHQETLKPLKRRSVTEAENRKITVSQD